MIFSDRTYSGTWRILIHIVHFHGIVCTLIMAAYSVTIFYQSCSNGSRNLIIAVMPKNRLTICAYQNRSFDFFCSLGLHFRATELDRWRGLNHFSQLIETTFTDGSKYEDMSKVSYYNLLKLWFLTLHAQIILFLVHQHFNRTEDPTGYLLLRCIRSYIEIDMYAALEVHTEDTIAAGEKELRKFAELIKVSLHISPWITSDETVHSDTPRLY